uniref:CTP synthase 1 n=1 Tax=Saccharomyces cerevisiae TaxID=4932 RepID=UPI001E1BDF91|nr:Chain D, CTP synthase 1 [Saccharomyces cerevisiae]7RMC_E Chain E, CTP synthase 1 [Saccharomyces cerevisiae]7RMC_F Chain F, CTP synthase 1 [Saccharomyces cerevisiae]7RMC_Q Chain Q, CTP synthase 1 [Saccharomyces cerevisiae]7RMC_R Chain R, CTP synthase 1 [Saccharomyces cerevisiae]7RMC_S Chain S, CTP synthase 1 [Saccharomyces cerevisiae]7RMC_T Chain T, CTP synthase 1 [Saccharomyces cerevisiae]7RMC_U Chain U, CTP synthase 1 [Saccharomyces cerevisiae]7RMC_V Chain V, CTP synthase 1 [Saccharomyc
MKYVVVSGGVISGIGKGVLASSTGMLMKTLGLKVTSIKIDPYMNIDAGTMSPLEHGECFVLDDGGETDLDLGNYERYLGVTLTKDHNITTGKIYSHVIAKERKGDYLGKTVQIVPHLTNAIQDWIERVAKIPVDDTGMEPDVCIIELGGTVGDIESAPFVEALRQFQFKVGKENFALIHVSLVPVIHGEQKTKPTQAAIKGLRSLGLVPDMIACRCSETLDKPTIDKIAMFCHVGPEQVVNVHDVNSTYHVPLLLLEQKMIDYLHARLKLDEISLTEEEKQRGLELLSKWKATTGNFDESMETVKIALVGKYTNLKDSYLSVIKALEHSSMKCRRKLDIKWVEATDLEPEAQESNKTKFHEAWNMVSTADGILIPGGFGVRGTEGMVLAARWARENHIPFLGVCLGLQIATIEFTRSVLGRKDSHSAEFYPDIDEKNHVVVFMMRLGLRPTFFQNETEWSQIKKLYGDVSEVHERHRHRYEINPKMVDELENNGLIFVGKDDTGKRCEILELKNHPYYIATQYHPEYTSKVLDPSKPFLGLVAASAGILQDVIEGKYDLEA